MHASSRHRAPVPRHDRRPGRVVAALVLLPILPLAVLVGCAGRDAGAADSALADSSVAARTSTAADSIVPAQPAACADDDAGLTLPDGFCAAVYADELGGPRHLAVRPNGDVLVMRMRVPRGDSGGVVVLRDTTGDGRADVRASFGPAGGTGIRLDGENLYIDATGAILRYRLPADAMRPAGAADTIVSGLPTGGHQAHTFVLDGRGNLLVNIGSRTNACQVADRQEGSKGHDPCTELETRAGIWRFDANRTGQRFSPDARFATGIRNAVALALGPGGELWAAQNGRDQLHENWGELFDERAGSENPGEELLQVNQGDDFGWPYCYYSTDHQRMVLAPEYGGDGSEVGRCASVKAPVAVFPGHWAPLGLLFYDGRQFPARYHDGVFIAFHGSWNRSGAQAGFNVTFQPLRDGQAAGQYEVFASGFPGAGAGSASRQAAEHRPVGLAQASDGSLLVADDRGGRVYRISYTGSR
ncbi:MAG TPA: PQQ-dependent sugar dehydrogenase [Gemmatimonadaceae bacterium]|nr:PQQ-dependent sugar dehydrogenase [Gemmatimonadaceae bacterium]